MRKSLCRCILLTFAATAASRSAFAITEQTASHVFDGRPYLWVEAENYSSLVDVNDNGWKVVSKETPIVSPQGRNILPANSNVSGTALLDDIGGGNHEDTATYEVKFATPGTYQFYIRHTMFDTSEAPGTFGNEDSFFMSPAFNKNSSTDWVGFQGLEFNDAVGASPDPGFALDPLGFEPGTGDHENEGWMAIRDWGVKDMGDVVFENDASNDFWNGQFHWYNRPSFVSVNDLGSFDDDFGFKTEYVVTPDMVGQTLTFEIGSREPYGVIDGFLFIKDDMVNLLDVHSQADLDALLVPPGPVLQADFNNSNSVTSADLDIWKNGFGTATGATKAMGDANGDQAVTGDDFLIWQRELGAAGAAVASGAIPEPATLALAAGAALALLASSRRRRNA
jgi:hypothetical protein